MNTVSLNMIIEINKILEGKNLNYKVHLKDACGCQSMWIEALNNQTITDEVYQIISEYFKGERMKLEFNSSDTGFRVVD